jgi:hypothetical protein
MHPGCSCPPPQWASKKLVQNPFSREQRLLRFVAVPQKLIPFYRGDNSNGILVARFGPLYAAQAAYPHWARQGDLVREGEKNFNGWPFLHILGKKEVHSAAAYVAGFGGSFTNGRPRSPTNGKREPHGKPLGSAAFWAGQDRPPSMKDWVYAGIAWRTIGLGVQILSRWKKYESTTTVLERHLWAIRRIQAAGDLLIAF